MKLQDYAQNKPVLETEQLILRPLRKEDVSDLKEWFFHCHAGSKKTLYHHFHILANLYDMPVQIVKPNHPLAPAMIDHFSQIFNGRIFFQFVQETVKILFLKDDFRIVRFL